MQDVFFGYSEKECVIENANLSVREGEFIGIIGPNGGGKTTLLKLLMGFLEPTKGTISIFDKSPKNYPNGMAYVPQNMHFDKLFPITVMELVLGGRLSHLPWWGKFSKSDKEKANEALKLVKLQDLAYKPFGSLSGGQAQRALIARALASEPKILLLDEPTANVDVNAVSEIYELLLELKKRLTILMVTHDIRAIIQHVERVLCVQRRIDSIKSTELCEHFAVGLYHFPLIQTDQSHLRAR